VPWLDVGERVLAHQARFVETIPLEAEATAPRKRIMNSAVGLLQKR